MYAVNVEGVKNVLDAARRCGVERIVHCSTIGTIGRRQDGGLPNEDTPFNLWETASHYRDLEVRGGMCGSRGRRCGPAGCRRQPVRTDRPA